MNKKTHEQYFSNLEENRWQFMDGDGGSAEAQNRWAKRSGDQIYIKEICPHDGNFLVSEFSFPIANTTAMFEKHHFELIGDLFVMATPDRSEDYDEFDEAIAKEFDNQTLEFS